MLASDLQLQGIKFLSEVICIKVWLNWLFRDQHRQKFHNFLRCNPGVVRLHSRDKSGWLPVFIKVLLEHIRAHSHTCYLWLLSYYSRVEQLWPGPFGPQNQITWQTNKKYFSSGCLPKKFVYPWCRALLGCLMN